MQNNYNNIIISTTNDVAGYDIVQHLGIVFGATVRSRGMGGDCSAGCASTCGGEVKAYTEMAIDARNQAITRMIDNAIQIGANAVIGMKFDSDQIGQGANNATVVYGTAVVIQKQ